MGSPALPDPMFDQVSSTTVSEFSRRKGSRKKVSNVGRKSQAKSMISKRLSKRRSK